MNLEEQMKKTKYIVFLTILFAVISKLSGFLRDIFLAFFYGANHISDAYMIAYTLPLVIVGLVGEAVNTSFIPTYIKIKDNNSIKKAQEFTVKLINILFLFTTIIIFIFMIFNETIINIFFPGIDADTKEISINFLKISIFSLYPMFLVYIVMSMAQIKHKFLKITILSLPMNIIFLLSIYFSKNVGIYILPYGLLLGTTSQLFLFKYEICEILKSYKLIFDFKDTNIKNIFILSIPVLMGVSLNQLNGIIDMNMASNVKVGGISIINYANRINTLLHGVISLTLANIAYPFFAKYITTKDYQSTNKLFENIMCLLNVILLPIVMLIVVYSNEIVQILYGHGSLGTNDIILTSKVLQLYTLSIIPIAYREILNRIFFSMSNTSAPFYASAIGVIFNITLNIILSNLIGLPGLALASSISFVISSLILMKLINKKAKEIKLLNIFIDFIKIFVITLFLFIVVVTLKYIIFLPIILEMFINILILSIIYLLILKHIKILNFHEIKVIFDKKSS